jgi:lipopolysaccharide transport system permease protein
MKKTIRIKSSRSLFDLRLQEVWDYRDLWFMFVKRDFLASFKQTILGPLWFFVQPVLTTLIFTFVFGNIAGLSTDGMPKVLFYMSGLVIWNYFSECFNKTANLFVSNASMFGKVYFPRLIMPLSIVTSGLIRFVIQFCLFLGILLYFKLTGDTNVTPNWNILYVPLLVVMMAGYALGLGMIISSMTTKYRDLSMLVGFGVTLLMYATPVIYPLNAVPEKYVAVVNANPLVPIVEMFRYAFLGSGQISAGGMLYSLTCMVCLLLGGILIFNKVEQNFMDTV